jgi:hypothetical protein
MNITRRNLLAAGAGAALLSGCAAITLAPAGAYKTERAFEVTLTRPWSDMTGVLAPRPRGVRLLTMDGAALNQLYLASLSPGAPLFYPAGVDREAPNVVYRADMSESEMVEFVVDSLAQTYQAPQSNNLRPEAFAGQPGVRFEVAMRTSAGLDMSATALVSRAGEKLNLLLFVAPRADSVQLGAYPAAVK